MIFVSGNCIKPNYMILYNKNIKYCSKCRKKAYLMRKNFKVKYKEFRKMSEDILDNMMKLYEDEMIRKVNINDTERKNS